MRPSCFVPRSVAIIVILTVLASFTTGQSIEGDWYRKEIRQKYSKQEVYITMRDGVRLFTSIYTPKDSTVPHPVLLSRTPYNIEPGGQNNFNPFIQAYSRYANGNYIMVYQDVRGTV